MAETTNHSISVVWYSKLIRNSNRSTPVDLNRAALADRLRAL